MIALKGVCHLPTNTHYIVSWERKSLFSPLDAIKVLYGLEIIIFRYVKYMFKFA